MKIKQIYETPKGVMFLVSEDGGLFNPVNFGSKEKPNVKLVKVNMEVATAEDMKPKVEEVKDADAEEPPKPPNPEESGTESAEESK